MAVVSHIKLPTAVSEDTSDEVLVHVRFHPNAEVFTIDERPEHLSSQDWFYRLYEGASQHYQVLAGGRGFFRIPRGRFEAISSARSN